MRDTSKYANLVCSLVLSRMTCVSLDSIGIAGFGHDFGALDGKRSTIEEIFDSFGSHPPGFTTMLIITLGAIFPFLWNIPDPRNRLTNKLHDSMAEISRDLLEKTRREKEMGGSVGDASRSIIGSLG